MKKTIIRVEYDHEQNELIYTIGSEATATLPIDHPQFEGLFLEYLLDMFEYLNRTRSHMMNASTSERSPT